MDQTMLQRLKSLLSRHEGVRTLAYVDSVGKITVGVGRNLTDRGLSPMEIDILLTDDIAYFNKRLNDTFMWFKDVGEARQIALIDMAFNLGFKGFCEFHDMIAALEIHDYDKASAEMITSKWAQQVGHRADELAKIVYTGELGAI